MTQERSAEEFKNFHKNLCKRFGYQHDEVDWKRDQASLEEHIANRIASSTKLIEESEAVVKELMGGNDSWSREAGRNYLTHLAQWREGRFKEDNVEAE